MSKAQKPSLALDLARQAAAAAKAEVLAESAPAAAPSGRWAPPALPEGFLLTPALHHAMASVAQHFASVLRHEGLDVVRSAANQPQPSAQTNGTTSPASPDVSVQEGGTGRLVRGYSTPAFLGLFASQQQRTGVVVDGQV